MLTWETYLWTNSISPIPWASKWLYNRSSIFLSSNLTCSEGKTNLLLVNNIIIYYTTQAVRGPITKINQSKCSIAGPIFYKYWTRHCPEWSRTCVFAFFSRVINLLLTKLARDRTGRISTLGLFCTDLAALGPYCQDPGPIFFSTALALG